MNKICSQILSNLSITVPISIVLQSQNYLIFHLINQKILKWSIIALIHIPNNLLMKLADYFIQSNLYAAQTAYTLNHFWESNPLLEPCLSCRNMSGKLCESYGKVTSQTQTAWLVGVVTYSWVSVVSDGAGVRAYLICLGRAARGPHKLHNGYKNSYYEPTYQHNKYPADILHT